MTTSQTLDYSLSLYIRCGGSLCEYMASVRQPCLGRPLDFEHSKFGNPSRETCKSTFRHYDIPHKLTSDKVEGYPSSEMSPFVLSRERYGLRYSNVARDRAIEIGILEASQPISVRNGEIACALTSQFLAGIVDSRVCCSPAWGGGNLHGPW